MRELANAVDRGVMMSAGEGLVGARHLGLGPRPNGEGHNGSSITLRFPEPPTLEQLRDRYIAMLIDRYGGNRQRIAGTLDISERNLYRLLKSQE